MKSVGCFLVLMCFVAAVPANADSDFTLFGAAQHQGSLTVRTASSTATALGSFDPATFGTFGIRIGHGKVMGGEHTVAYAPNFLEANTKAIIYNSDFLVQAPLPKVKPYATAGLGTIFTWGEDSSGRPAFANLGNRFALNYGGGVKVLPAGPVGIRVDIRGYLIPSVKFNVLTPTAADPLATVKSQSQTLNMLEAGFGIIFNLGK
jgi:hypothetical protein